MKKVLLVMLALAVAGGSAFAQGWTFNGLISGGLGLVFQDDVDEMQVAPVTNDGLGTGFRAQLDARFTNADATGGIAMRLRGHTTENATTGIPERSLNAGGAGGFNWAFGWLSFADNMVTVYGGLVDHGYFNAQDRLFAEDSGEGLGLLTVLRPMDGLTLGFGAFTRTSNELMWVNPDDDTLGADNQVRGTFHVRYEMPDFLRITAGFRNTAEGGGGNGNNIADSSRTLRTLSQFYVSAAYLADSDMHAAFTARLQGLEEFGDEGIMRFYASFAHSGLVDDMILHAGASFGMVMNDDFWWGNATSPHIWVWVGAEYALSDRIVPRLDVHYVMGGTWNHANQIHNASIRDGVTFFEEDTFAHIRPSVQFRVTSASFVELGAIVHLDLGDDAGNGNPTWLRTHGTHIGAYALVRVAF